MKEIFLDIETLRWSDEVEGGWKNIPGFGMALAVTWCAVQGYREWEEEAAAELIEHLKTFDRIVTFNGERFDFIVLSAYGAVEELYPRSFDLMAELTRMLGFRLSLDQLAVATLGRGKTGDGRQAVLWWRSGRPEYRRRVAEYCRNDVYLLQGLVKFGAARGHLFYRDPERGIVRIEYPAPPDVPRRGSRPSARTGKGKKK